MESRLQRPTLSWDRDLGVRVCKVILLWAMDIRRNVGETTAPAHVHSATLEAQERGESLWPAGLKERVRDILRHGSYKPSGRAKPASEFLLRSAVEGVFPSISTLVNINNVVSLRSGYPASILDMELSGPELALRRGRPGESYVFNRAGHAIQLTDLLVVCRREEDGWKPCANPVKDAMETKVSSDTRHAVGVLFAPADEPGERIERFALEYLALLRTSAEAQGVGYCVYEI